MRPRWLVCIVIAQLGAIWVLAIAILAERARRSSAPGLRAEAAELGARLCPPLAAEQVHISERVLLHGAETLQPGLLHLGLDGTIVAALAADRSAARAYATARPSVGEFHDHEGRVLSPGLIDVHVHISALGRGWEGYESATRAAAAGGITALVGMPLNSVPPLTTIASLEAEAGELLRLLLLLRGLLLLERRHRQLLLLRALCKGGGGSRGGGGRARGGVERAPLALAHRWAGSGRPGGSELGGECSSTYIALILCHVWALIVYYCV
jgi:hypothetical protein